MPQAAQPEYEFSIEITTGMSAPPIGTISRKPKRQRQQHQEREDAGRLGHDEQHDQHDQQDAERRR